GEDVRAGKAPVLYPVGNGELARIEVGPGLVTLLGGAPAAGKTALAMQAVVDALRLTPTLRACVCNVEMAPPVLLDRQLARLSGIDLTAIRHRRGAAQPRDRLEPGLAPPQTPADPPCLVPPPLPLGDPRAPAP